MSEKDKGYMQLAISRSFRASLCELTKQLFTLLFWSLAPVFEILALAIGRAYYGVTF